MQDDITICYNCFSKFYGESIDGFFESCPECIGAGMKRYKPIVTPKEVSALKQNLSKALSANNIGNSEKKIEAEKQAKEIHEKSLKLQDELCNFFDAVFEYKHQCEDGVFCVSREKYQNLKTVSDEYRRRQNKMKSILYELYLILNEHPRTAENANKAQQFLFDNFIQPEASQTGL